MPSTPYAKVLVSINGGANTSGGLEYANASAPASVALSGESTVGWQSALWEIYEYPAGFATPTGWTLNGTTGVLYSTAFTPASFALNAGAPWGKYLFRLTVNGGLLNGMQGAQAPAAQPMIDATTAISVESPNGLRDTGYEETNQFDTQRQWAAAYKANLRAIDSAFSAAGGYTTVTSLVGGQTRTLATPNELVFCSPGTAPGGGCTINGATTPATGSLFTAVIDSTCGGGAAVTLDAGSGHSIEDPFNAGTFVSHPSTLSITTPNTRFVWVWDGGNNRYTRIN